MGGMLGYGAAAGAAGEYLKQSDEKRTNEYQAIRDKRVGEIRKENIKFSAGLVTNENKRKEGVTAEGVRAERDYKAKNYSFSYGETVVRDGKEVSKGRDRPLAGAGAGKEKGSLMTLISGDKRTYKELRETYDSIAKANTDEFGRRIGDFDLPEFDEWLNARVIPSQRINPKQQGPAEPEEPSTEDFKAARESYNEDASMFSSDKTQFGMSEEEFVNKRAQENMKTRLEGGGADKNKKGGLLTQGSERPKVKKPLSNLSRTSPVRMYEELMEQFGYEGSEVGEKDVLDTVREYFHDPTWKAPSRR